VFFKSHPITSLYFTQEFALDERLEEKFVSEFCEAHNIIIHRFDQSTLIAENDLPFKLDKMPFIFTEFRKRIEQQLKIKPPVPPPFETAAFEIKHDSSKQFLGGEDHGLARLWHYIWKSDAVQTYKETRNGLIHFDHSTKFSPWLNSGCLSARTVYHQLKIYEVKACENESTYWLFFELLWRDYFKFFSLKFGNKIFLANGLNPGSSPNLSDLSSFNSWCEGKTQDSFINANMIELNQTGWMSNRGRQNVASYLIHDLGVNWTWGASYFEEKLIDYDPDLNWGNWLYLSGRGSDPRARKFNTIKQAETYDPNGEYRQLWR
jgi:deoxyribodipyrimidine photo-lyase